MASRNSAPPLQLPHAIAQSIPGRGQLPSFQYADCLGFAADVAHLRLGAYRAYRTGRRVTTSGTIPTRWTNDAGGG